MAASEPRQHRDAAFLAAKQARLGEPHLTAINLLARDIATATGSVVPSADPDGGGVRARILILLETPSRAGGYRTGIVSLDNDDSAAANLWRALTVTRVDRREVLVWNTVPWYVGTPEKIRPPRPSEVDEGRRWLLQLIDRLPELVVIIGMGRAAASALTPLRTELEVRGLVIMETPHPSQRAYNRPNGAARERIEAALIEASHQLHAPDAQPPPPILRGRW
jgi:uracil-DNA glycosylase